MDERDHRSWQDVSGQEISGQSLWQWRQVALAALGREPELGRELDLLLQAYTDIDSLSFRLETYRTRPTIPLGCDFADLQQLWQRRVKERVPLQYLIGQTAWRNFHVQVAPGVLIPRPETELLIDFALAAAVNPGPTCRNPAQTQHWADLGTGSGVIAIGLALAFPTATIHAVDLSPVALAVAQQNLTRMGLNDRIQLHQGSWCQPLANWRGQLTGIVSNPPYIPTAMVAELQPEVADHEPHLALDGGSDGLVYIRAIIDQAPDYLKPGGLLLIELMQHQAASVTELLAATGTFTQIQIHSDLSGIERFAQATRV